MPRYWAYHHSTYTGHAIVIPGARLRHYDIDMGAYSPLDTLVEGRTDMMQERSMPAIHIDAFSLGFLYRQAIIISFHGLLVAASMHARPRGSFLTHTFVYGRAGARFTVRITIHFLCAYYLYLEPSPWFTARQSTMKHAPATSPKKEMPSSASRPLYQLAAPSRGQDALRRARNFSPSPRAMICATIFTDARARFACRHTKRRPASILTLREKKSRGARSFDDDEARSKMPALASADHIVSATPHRRGFRHTGLLRMPQYSPRRRHVIFQRALTCHEFYQPP